MNQDLLCLNQLDATTLDALDELVQQCKQNDGNHINVYKPLLSRFCAIPRSLLLYQHQQLTGFLSGFFFHEKSCEIVLMIAPQFRHQKIATQLLQHFLSIPDMAAIDTLTFASPHQLNDSWLPLLGLHYKSSEYQMKLLNKPLAVTHRSTTRVRRVSFADIPTLCAIDEASFPNQGSDLLIRYRTILNDSSYTVLLLTDNEIPVGKVHLCNEAKSMRLSDLAVLPRLQRQGYGTELLAWSVEFALQAGKATTVLDVESHHEQALKLYTRIGFTINNAQDYWSCNKDEFITKNASLFTT